MHGISLAVVKAALFDLLSARAGLAETAVLYQPPAEGNEVLGPTGRRWSVFFADSPQHGDGEVAADAGWAAAKTTLGGLANVEEDYVLRVVAQALGRDTDDSQRDLDGDVATLAGQILDTIRSDRTLSTADRTDWPDLEVELDGWSYQSGYLAPAGIRAASIAVQIRVRASTC